MTMRLYLISLALIAVFSITLSGCFARHINAAKKACHQTFADASKCPQTLDQSPVLPTSEDRITLPQEPAGEYLYLIRFSPNQRAATAVCKKGDRGSLVNMVQYKIGPGTGIFWVTHCVKKVGEES